MGKRGRASRVRPRRASIAVAWRNDERGATLIIVAVTLVAIFAMLTLTVDVGGLLYKRRELVNGADAAALAAAQSCAGIGADAFSTPEDAADHYAMANVNGLTSWQGGIIGPPGGCVAPTKDQPSG